MLHFLAQLIKLRLTTSKVRDWRGKLVGATERRGEGGAEVRIEALGDFFEELLVLGELVPDLLPEPGCDREQGRNFARVAGGQLVGAVLHRFRGRSARRNDEGCQGRTEIFRLLHFVIQFLDREFMAQGTVLVLALDADDLGAGGVPLRAFGGYLDVEIHAMLGAAGPGVSLPPEGLKPVLQDVLTELLELLVVVRG